MNKKQETNYMRIQTDGPCFDDEKLDVMLKEIGARIKNERIRQNLSVNQLAECTGLNITHLYRVENGSKPIGLKGLIKVAIVLNMPISYFIPFEQNEFVPTSSAVRFIELTRDLDAETLEFAFDFIKHLRDFLDKN